MPISTPTWRPNKPPFGPLLLDPTGPVPPPSAAWLMGTGPGGAPDYTRRNGILVPTNGPTWTTSKFGEFSFVAASSQYLIGTGPDLSGGPFTISFLFNSPLSGEGCCVGVGTATSTDQLIHLTVGNNGGGDVKFGMWSDDLQFFTSPAIVANTTYRLTFTMDAAKLQNVYVNGVSEATRTAGGFYSGNSTWNIGRRGNGDTYYGGIVYDVFAWRGIALTPTQIVQHYNDPYATLVVRPLRRGFVAASGGATFTDASQGSTGLESQNIDVAARSGAATGHAGLRGQCVGVKSVASPDVGSIGERGQSVDVKNASAATIGHTGIEGVDASLPARSSTATGSVGIRSTDAGASARTGVAAGKTGLESIDVGASSKTGATLGSVGFESQTLGFQPGARSSQGSIGMRAQAQGTKSSSGAAVGRTGARGQCSGPRGAISAALGRIGLRGATAGGNVSPRMAIGSFGFRGQALGAAFTAMAPTVNDVACVGDATLPEHVVWPVGVARTYSNTGGVDYTAPLVGCDPPPNSVKPWEI